MFTDGTFTFSYPLTGDTNADVYIVPIMSCHNISVYSPLHARSLTQRLNTCEYMNITVSQKLNCDSDV